VTVPKLYFHVPRTTTHPLNEYKFTLHAVVPQGKKIFLSGDMQYGIKMISFHYSHQSAVQKILFLLSTVSRTPQNQYFCGVITFCTILNSFKIPLKIQQRLLRFCLHFSQVSASQYRLIINHCNSVTALLHLKDFNLFAEAEDGMGEQ
jgi:hypothetical protein